MKNKTIFILILLIIALFIISCTKQKNCDCGVIGVFVYYKTPEKIIYCGNEQRVNAVFISDISRYYHIFGDVPKEFRNSEGIRVIACLEEIPKHGCLTYGVGTIYKLTCIEKMN